ncbi:hypothetical protein [Pseudomonas citronellolis]|uniref:hypothetical protein n=1 Tax=Pseudomonas citronellolis TaxID=53408 RepID=UPI0023E44A79|nr:hypothetical protein [Pseudomonas citronellolis]MDF3932154.1 hypothetical protein [Pseudomonas citronellolis]
MANTSQLKSDLNRLTDAERKARSLAALEERGSRPATTGTGSFTAPAATGTGGGIASPLTEASYLERTYWPDKVITSTDGLFSFKIKPIRAIRQLDANNAEVIQQFAEPVSSP